MCGLSVSALFAILTRVIDAEERPSPELQRPPVPAPEAESAISL